MQFANDLAALCVDHQLGGPFAAVVFELESGRIVSVGVNQVVQSCCSLAHAEMVALALAQRALGSYSLAPTPDRPVRHELVTTCEPCAMCFGGVLWSGVVRLVCGADSACAERIGFDEGPKVADWESQLEQRGIQLVQRVGFEAAKAILERYAASGAPLYNACEGDYRRVRRPL